MADKMEGARIVGVSIDETVNAFGEGIKWMEPTDIGWAVRQLKAGFQVARAGWNGKGQWLQLQRRDANSKMTLNYVYICTVDGDLVPWLCSQTDLLAEDWQFA